MGFSDHPHPAMSSTSGHFKSQCGRMIEIREVWASNLDVEFENIRSIISKYPYVAMVRVDCADMSLDTRGCLQESSLCFTIAGHGISWSCGTPYK